MKSLSSLGFLKKESLFESKHGSILDETMEKKKERNRNASLKIFSSLSLSVFLLRSGQTRSILEITCPSTYLIHTHTQTHETGQLVIIPTIISTSTTISIYHQAGINCPINTPDPAALLGRKVGAAIIKSNYQKNNAIQ